MIKRPGRMWADLDENLHSGAGEARDRLCQGAGGMCRAFPLSRLESVRDDVGRASQASEPATWAAATSPMPSPIACPGMIPQDFHKSANATGGRTGPLWPPRDHRSLEVFHARSSRPPATIRAGDRDGIKPPDRIAERGLPKEQVSPRTRPVIPRTERRKPVRDDVLEAFVLHATEVRLAPAE